MHPNLNSVSLKDGDVTGSIFFVDVSPSLDIGDITLSYTSHTARIRRLDTLRKEKIRNYATFCLD